MSEHFKLFITGLLKQSGVSKKYIGVLTTDDCMKEFTKAFTHKTIDPINNYEYYETLGDATTNKIVVWYYHRRFPELFNNPGGGNMGPVAIMARLKQEGVSKRAYSSFSERLGFWEHVIATDEAKKSRKSILEDLFESFVGCLEHLIDSKIQEYCGYAVVYTFMKGIMDGIDINISREALYDEKSLLNEQINSFPRGRISVNFISIDRSIGDSKFLSDPKNISSRFKSVIEIIDNKYNKKYISKEGWGSTKKDSEKNTAKNLRVSGLLDRLKDE